MDLGYLTGQRPADVLATRATDVVDGFLQFAQGKTTKKLRIRLESETETSQLGILVERLLTQRKARGVRNPYMIVTEDGRNVTPAMLRLRFDDAKSKAAAKAAEDQDSALAESIRQFQFRDIRPKAASEIEDLAHASRLLGHTDKRITQCPGLVDHYTDRLPARRRDRETNPMKPFLRKSCGTPSKSCGTLGLFSVEFSAPQKRKKP